MFLLQISAESFPSNMAQAEVPLSYGPRQTTERKHKAHSNGAQKYSERKEICFPAVMEQAQLELVKEEGPSRCQDFPLSASWDQKQAPTPAPFDY